jgi:hypothetical protein
MSKEGYRRYLKRTLREMKRRRRGRAATGWGGARRE